MSWRWVPWGLVLFRGASALVLMADSLDKAPSWWFVHLFVLAFISHVFDGMAARKLGVVTPQLRKADGIIDLTLYFVMAASSMLIFQSQLLPFLVPALVLLFLQVGLQVYSRLKFSKGTSFHGWSAKLWGLTIASAFIALFGFGLPQFLWICLAAGLVNTLEEGAMLWALPQWEHDVWSLKAALKIRAEQSAAVPDRQR